MVPGQVGILVLFNNYSKCVLAAYCMGSMNKDCWYMYTMKDFSRKMTSEPDQTIEILMSELDPEVMQFFTKRNPAQQKLFYSLFFCLEIGY